MNVTLLNRVNRWVVLIVAVFGFFCSLPAKTLQIDVQFPDELLSIRLKKISTQANASILFDPQLVKDTRSEALSSTKNMTTGQLIAQSLKGTPFSYKKTAATSYAIIRKDDEKETDALTVPHGQGTISGTVLDEAGNPVTGVTVSIPGTTIGTVTDVNGKYSLSNIPEGTVNVQFTFMSYETQLMRGVKVIADKATSLDVVLKETMTQLGEVVVTALGIKKDVKKLGYAVQEINNDEISEIPSTNFASQLSGKVAGLTVFNTPNLLQENRIELRGRSPLIVINGVPTNSNAYDISAMDIDKVVVLKGATAAALYGSKGQNGAIQIITKSAQKGTSIELSQRSVFNMGWIVYPKVQTKYGNGEKGQYAYFDGQGNGTYDNDFIWGPALDKPDPSTSSGIWETPQWDSPIDADGNRIPTPFTSRGKNNLKNFLETGYTLSNNIAITYGTEKGSIRAGFGYDYTNGAIPNTSLKNYNASLNTTFEVTKKLKLTANIAFNRQDSPNFPRIIYGNSNILYNMLIWAGTDVDMRAMKNYWKPGRENYEQVYFNYSWINNPYFTAYEQLETYVRDKTNGIFLAEYKLNDHFEFDVRQSIETIRDSRESKFPFDYVGMREGEYGINNNDWSEFNTELFIKYNDTFGKFGLNAFVGAATNYKQSKNIYSKTHGLKVPNVYNLANTKGAIASTNNLTEYARNSVFTSVDIDYLNTYYLSLTGRVDKSSALPTQNNSYFYPSASGSVILSNLLGLPTSTFLKARGTWSVVRADLQPYEYMTAYMPAVIYGTEYSVSYPNVLGNNELKAQNTSGYELGLGGTLLKGLLNFDLTYYNYIDSDMIFDQPASIASGFISHKINGNKFRRYGFEAIVGTDINITKEVKWNSAINWSLYRNVLKEIHGGADNLNGVKVGERLDKYMTTNTMMKSPSGELIIGDNGLPVRDTELKSLGHRGPSWTASWSNKFSYKNFDLSFLFEARIGGKDQANMNRQMWYSGAHPNSVGWEREDYVEGKPYIAKGVNVVSGSLTTDANGNVVDTRVFKENDRPTDYKSFSEQYYYRMSGETNAFDLSFLKMREISLGYTFRPQLLEKLNIGMKQASLSVVASNLFIISDFPMSDPDEGSGGMDENKLQFPSYRNIGFNINVKF